MERKRAIGLVVALLMIFSVDAGASSNAAVLANYRCVLYSSYVSGKVTDWGKLLPAMEKSYQENGGDDLLLEIARTHYGLVAFLINNNSEDEAEAYLKQGLAEVEQLLTRNPSNAEAMALKASFTAFRIAISPYLGPFLGPRSLGYIDEAMKFDGKNPYVLIDKANAKQFTPGIFGGDLDEAVGYYKQSIAAFERMDPSECRWVYLNALANLGTCYEKMGQYANAEATYRKALTVAPDFHWVKYFLLPKLQKRLAKT